MKSETNAGPLPLSAVIPFISSSFSTVKLFPIALKIFSTSFLSLVVIPFPKYMAEAPSSTNAGVLGMTLTILPFFPRALLITEVVTPAAIEIKIFAADKSEVISSTTSLMLLGLTLNITT